LVKICAWKIASKEALAWDDLDHPDLYMQWYKELYGSKYGTLVPFSLRLIFAELPQYTTSSTNVYKKLFEVLTGVRKVCILTNYIILYIFITVFIMSRS